MQQSVKVEYPLKQGLKPQELPLTFVNEAG